MTFSIRRCTSYDTANRAQRGFELVIELGSLGFQFFVGLAK